MILAQNCLKQQNPREVAPLRRGHEHIHYDPQTTVIFRPWLIVQNFDLPLMQAGAPKNEPTVRRYNVST